MTDGAAPTSTPVKAPDTVVFDIGEVLIDETRVWAVWAELLGVSLPSLAAVLGAAIVQGESIAATFAHLAPNVDWRELEEEHEGHYGGFRPEDLYRDVRPCLEALVGDGFRVYLVGNQPARRGPQLEALALACHGVTTSEAIGLEKPDPAFFNAVRELVDREDASQVLYVGDRVDNDLLPAATAGMRTCWVRRGPWGQLQDLPDGAEEPDLVLEGLGELPVLLTTWRAETA